MIQLMIPPYGGFNQLPVFFQEIYNIAYTHLSQSNICVPPERYTLKRDVVTIRESHENSSSYGSLVDCPKAGDDVFRLLVGRHLSAGDISET